MLLPLQTRAVGLPGSVPFMQHQSDPKAEGLSENDTIVIRSHLLIPGRGDPIRDGAVAVRDGKITWVGSYPDLPSKYKNVKPTCVPILMPGLWDCHVHFLGGDVMQGMNLAAFTSYLPGSNALSGAIIVDDLRATLMAGYTSVRELGGYAGDVWPAVEIGHTVGPNLYSSIAAMSITGGHGDDHFAALETVQHWQKCGGPVALADGPTECVKTVRQLVRRGARCIKVCSTGGVLSMMDDPEDQQFSEEELRAIVDEAARSRRAVAAHAIGKAGIVAAIKAGVKSIEHGMYIDEEVADLMLERDVLFVPTHHIVETLARHHEWLPLPMRRKLLNLTDKARSSYKLCIKKGVKIALGSDTLASTRSDPIAHGNNARELYWAVKMGMSPLEAIQATTANAPEVLGGMAPLSGQIKAGYDADLIGVLENPLEDIEVLNKVEKITHVWKGGRLYKSPRGRV